MKRDWREIEKVIAAYFDGCGFSITSAGDVFAETRGNCFLAQAGERCPGIEAKSINLTMLARQIAEEVA